ncbi:unnamed protein product [Clonostachys solani]|uniref:Uncharacterized protein n=1 Tax=Clonostachys solani TaxID=160281 RepID=A0A9N9ZKD1_9HYPO|nr:unnamed protein product [Clonostachys solani]
MINGVLTCFLYSISELAILTNPLLILSEDYITEIYLGVRIKKRYLLEVITLSLKRFKVDLEDKGSFRDIISIEASLDPYTKEEF